MCGGGGGGQRGEGGPVLMQIGSGHTFCAIENEGLHKILQPFLKGHVFCCIAISILQNETKEESIIRQILFFFIKMMAYQTNITWC